MKLTAAIIAKNEARNIVDCVRSVAFCDEVLVVDSGSTDGTPSAIPSRSARTVGSLPGTRRSCASNEASALA